LDVESGTAGVSAPGYSNAGRQYLAHEKERKFERRPH
jgi:hypothetical protein